jgi:hypothetical protein
MQKLGIIEHEIGDIRNFLDQYWDFYSTKRKAYATKLMIDCKKEAIFGVRVPNLE